MPRADAVRVALATAGLLGACLALGACGTTTTHRQAPVVTSWPWQVFPDIPLPRGWLVDPGYPLTVSSIAGGTVRRLDARVVMEPDSGRNVEPIPALETALSSILPNYGWRADGPHRWRKDDDLLRLESGASWAQILVVPAP